MGDNTAIEWTDATWNPIRGCTRVSAGCTRCYAERVAARFSKPGQPYHGLARMTKDGPRWTGEVRVVEKHLADPLRWAQQRRIFVNSMSDLFHEGLSDAAIDRVFAVMAVSETVGRCRRRNCDHDTMACGDAGAPPAGHTFQVLTKRPERLRQYLAQDRRAAWRTAAGTIGWRFTDGALDEIPWPLRNVWLGVSVEDQATANARIPLLLDTPAEVRFVSYEPALGPVDFAQINRWDGWGNGARVAQPIGGGLDWVIVGGESGPGARMFDVAWARSMIAQCRTAGVECFVKQLGALPVDLTRMPHNGPITARDLAHPEIAETLGRQLDENCQAACLSLVDRKGGDMAEWPEDLRVREFPAVRS